MYPFYSYADTTLTFVPANVAECFRPNNPDGCVTPIVNVINSAQTEIRVQAYNFTSPPILSALANAKRRGVDVAVILDKSNDPISKEILDENGNVKPPKASRYTGATYMTNAGVPVFIDRKPRIAHNKLIIIDKHLVVGGSYNYTMSAEKANAENVTFIDSADVASSFLNNWELRKQVSEVFVPKSQ